LFLLAVSALNLSQNKETILFVIEAYFDEKMLVDRRPDPANEAALGNKTFLICGVYGRLLKDQSWFRGCIDILF